MEDKNSQFRRLVSELDQADKEKLLEKIRSQIILVESPLVDEGSTKKPDSFEARYQKISWYKRIWYWLIGVFTGKSTQDVFLNIIVTDEGKKIELLFPSILDTKDGLLKERFRNALEKLKKAARFFYCTLDASVNKDREAFMGYLGSIIMNETHLALAEASNPDKMRALSIESSDVRLVSAAIEQIEDIIFNIPEKHRAVMYEQARMIFCLKELACFLYDRLLMSFAKAEGQENLVCPLSLVTNQLIVLDKILFSIKNVPSFSLLSALFIFCMEEYHNESDFDQDRELQKFIQGAEQAIAVIRSFGKSIPLTMLIRYSLRNLSWEPVELTGGEDWLQVYKNYWVETTKVKFHRWLKEKKELALSNSLNAFFKSVYQGLNQVSGDSKGGSGLDKLIKLEYIRQEGKADGNENIPVSNVLSLQFFLTFHKYIFMPAINMSIRPVLINGEFHIPGTAEVFAKAYNCLINLDTQITNLDAAVGPAGEYGKQWVQLGTDIQSISARKRKMHTIIEEVNDAADDILEKTRESISTIKNILTQILAKTVDGSGVLNNFQKLQSTNQSLKGSLSDAVSTLNTALKIYNNIKEIEALSDGAD